MSLLSAQKVNVKDRPNRKGTTRTLPNSHMANFFDAIRTGVAVNCPLEIGFRTAVACRMAVDSYRLQRTVRWDAQREEII